MLSTIWSWIEPLMPWLGYLLLFAACAAGLLLNIVGLPGIWLMVLAGMTFVWWTDSAYAGWTPILFMVGIGIVAEVCEFLAGAAGAKQAGGTRRGMAGALVGGLVGAIACSILIPIPIVGTIIGAVLGSALGAFFIEWGWVGTERDQATTIAVGAAKGRFLGMLLKSIFGIAMATILLFSAIPWDVATPATLPATVLTSMPSDQP
jgi:uncharacterized protein